MTDIGSALVKFKGQAKQLLRSNSPVILTAIGVSGTLSTAYLAGKASYAAAERIRAYEKWHGRTDDTKERVKVLVPEVWQLYIPTAISAGITVSSIILASRVSSKRTAAITAAYSISEKAFAEYKDKIAEKFGEQKEQTVRDEIAQDKVTENPPVDKSVIITGTGNVLCCELETGRYFNSDMETLRKAQNDVNAKLLREMYATLSDFYYLVGLPYTSHSSDIGWESDRQMELIFSTVMSEDDRPCIAFDYNYNKPL